MILRLSSGKGLDGARYRSAFQNFFFMEGRNNFKTFPPTIKIGKKDLPEDSLSITLEKEPDPTSSFYQLGDHLVFTYAGHQIRFPLSWTAHAETFHHRENPRSTELSLAGRRIPSCFLGANGLNPYQSEALWNRIIPTPLEDDVINAIGLIAPDVERLVVKPIEEKSLVRVPFVRLKGADHPVTLRSLGDGMNRIFGIALALVNAKEGMLLIDEVENGLHYSVQPDIWRLIFQTASRLNVQVFATTHSFDCIKAFEVAARESAEEGVLIRLAQKAGRIFVGEFDEHDLGVAVEGQIEVR